MRNKEISEIKMLLTNETQKPRYFVHVCALLHTCRTRVLMGSLSLWPGTGSAATCTHDTAPYSVHITITVGVHSCT